MARAVSRLGRQGSNRDGRDLVGAEQDALPMIAYGGGVQSRIAGGCLGSLIRRCDAFR